MRLSKAAVSIFFGISILFGIAWNTGTGPPAAGALNTAAAGDNGERIPDRQLRAREDERREMVRTIRSYGLKDPRVLAAMEAVPRHLFVPVKYNSSAYADTPLPIGHGQTISQPFIVAEMTRLLALKENAKVLEVGTGSGYQAAVLARFTPHVYTIEIIKPLADAAELRLRQLGCHVHTRHGDGYFGWPEAAPFDGIVVTAAAGEIPPPLIQQLAAGGRMVIPVGPVFATQSLMRLQKDDAGRVTSQSLMPVRFVPLTRQDGSTR